MSEYYAQIVYCIANVFLNSLSLLCSSSTDLSSEENVNECTDNPATVAPCHTKRLSVENKEKSGTVPESILSPDSIYSVVHLLGSLKSEEDDEDESDISQEM